MTLLVLSLLVVLPCGYHIVVYYLSLSKLNSPIPAERIAGARRLGDVWFEGAAIALAQVALEDVDDNVRIFSAKAIRRNRNRDSGIDEIVRRVKSGNDVIKHQGLLALRLMGPDAMRAKGCLIALSMNQDYNGLVWHAAVLALREVAPCDPATIERFWQGLRSEDPWLGDESARALDFCGVSHEAIAKVLCGLLQAEDPGVRGTAVGALGQFAAAGEFVLPSVVGLLSDSDAWVRMRAVGALSQFANLPEPVRRMVEQALSDSDASVREAAEWVKGR